MVDTQQNCAKHEMTDAQLIRAVYQRHTMKRLAQAMNAPLETARSWLYRSFSPARRRELALALIAEFDRQDAERALVRAHLLDMGGGAIGDEGTGARKQAVAAALGGVAGGVEHQPINEAVEPSTSAKARAEASGVG